MQLKGIKFRYINFACYEIILPNGKEIVIDPCHSMNVGGKKDKYMASGSYDIPSEWMDYQGADYVIISHTHGDHTLDLGYLCENYHPKVVCGAMSAQALAEHYNINCNELYPVFPNEKLEFEDFTLEAFRGKHTFPRGNNNTIGYKKEHRMAVEDSDAANMAGIMGSIEYVNYVLTTKDNIRIVILGGQPNSFYFNNDFEVCKKYAPNIVFKQSSSKYTPEQFAETLDQFGGQLALPVHPDGLLRSPINCTKDEWFQKANKHLEEIGSSTRILDPVPLKWYGYSVSVIEE